MWGTDWTRAVKLLSCAEGVDAFRIPGRLSGGDRANLTGGMLSSIYNWSPPKAEATLNPVLALAVKSR